MKVVFIADMLVLVLVIINNPNNNFIKFNKFKVVIIRTSPYLRDYFQF